MIWLIALLVALAALDSWLSRKAVKCGCLSESKKWFERLGKYKYYVKAVMILVACVGSYFIGDVGAGVLGGLITYYAIVCFKIARLIRKHA